MRNPPMTDKYCENVFRSYSQLWSVTARTVAIPVHLWYFRSSQLAPEPNGRSANCCESALIGGKRFKNRHASQPSFTSQKLPQCNKNLLSFELTIFYQNDILEKILKLFKSNFWKLSVFKSCGNQSIFYFRTNFPKLYIF